MAQLIFSTIGQAVGSRIAPAALRGLGAALGHAAGSMLGRGIDQSLFGETRRIEGPRLSDLHVQGSTEGASIPAVYGRVRIAGQVIWAARHKEHRRTTTSSTGGGKGGGGPRVSSTTYSYSLSFAVGLCEGEIARIGRVWANGAPFDLTAVNWRLHKGAQDQAPDPLIEAIEGAEHAPAYRGLAYIVFEDLPLAEFGNAIPQLSFEIIRASPRIGDAPRLEDRARGVCLIPGAGEFVYATAPVRRVIGPGAEAAENVHAERERANLLVSLDQLEADLPNCANVLLVTAWFGDDLRCGHCAIRPGVEIAAKQTSPLAWRAGGVTRGGAHVVSLHEGAPAFGGTPSDETVLQAIAELKARGFKVGLYPFVLMDVPAGNALPDPYGAAAQAAYPWRGRIGLDPAPGQPGSPDKTSAATAQIDAFFGAAAPGDFSASGGVISYAGPSEWSYRRFILHYAKLAQAAGGVDAFLIGSELRGLTTARASASHFPAVDQLRDLAGDVRGLVGAETKITYGADWSEYFGHQPQDGSNDVYFHLDPLWADSNIDVIGLDWYPPLSDWREGSAHLDAALARGAHDGAYLRARIEGGEAFEWFYASSEDRAAQTRTPISDGAYSEPWIFRAKDIRNFWARAHYDRPGGVRAASPTAWTPQSKPIWLTELGCPALDKGANAPNLFVDDKSAESAWPPFSTGARDDLIQRRALEAYLDYWAANGANNPASGVYDGAMIDPDGVFLWAWDARPFPAFPARGDVWADGAAWRRGHWLNGRAGLSGLGETVADICARAGATDVDVAALHGAVSGYVVDAPSSARAALEPLMAAYGFDAAEQEGAIVFAHRADAPVIDLALGDLAAESAADLFAARADSAEAPVEARVRFLDPARDYLIGAVSARQRDAAGAGIASIDAPLVLEIEAAAALADITLAEARARGEAARLAVGPALLRLEPGDRARLSWLGADLYDIARIEDGETRRLDLRRAAAAGAGARSLAEPAAPPSPLLAPTPAIALLDLPPLPGREADERPLAAVFAAPWTGAHEVYLGPGDDSLSLRGVAEGPAVMGELAWALWPGPVDRWDEGNRIRIRLYGGALESVTPEALLAGANAFAVEGAGGEWEIVQALNAVLVEPDVYELSGFLRGQLASAHAMRAPHPVGARIVALGGPLARLEIGAHEWREALRAAAPPAGAAASDPRAARLDFTPPHAAARPWPPAHLRAWRDGAGDVQIRWVRCARLGGDSWGPGEPPLSDGPERYLLEIWDGEALKRSVEVPAPEFAYLATAQAADFGGPPAFIRIKAAQIGADGAPGLKRDLTIPL